MISPWNQLKRPLSWAMLAIRRSEKESLFSQGLLSNKPLLGAVLFTFVLQLATIYMPFLKIRS